ncbi:MAG: tRNA adenosine(34) deaminase TadA [Lachnospiraceae bacterium]|nr:tRNA adenosine(34) deaminase TadA [Lachnospiraceae bacterium]
MKLTQDEKYMRAAINLAKRGRNIGEVPIGCVIVYEGKIIGRGYNKRKKKKTTLAHAEIEAIAKAGKVIKDWRLEDCDIYITLEPCQMCAGAIVQARMRRCIIGCKNPKAGCAGSVLNILQNDSFNHRVELTEGVLEEECSAMLTEFFKELRLKNAELKKAGSGGADEQLSIKNR